MELCSGWSHDRIPLSATRHYLPEEIIQLCKRRVRPFWLNVQGKHIQVQGKESLELACNIACVYHNQIAYNAQSDDGFGDEMEHVEREVQARMDEVLSDEGGW